MRSGQPHIQHRNKKRHQRGGESRQIDAPPTPAEFRALGALLTAWAEAYLDHANRSKSAPEPNASPGVV
jgi:hypothetical protein